LLLSAAVKKDGIDPARLTTVQFELSNLNYQMTWNQECVMAGPQARELTDRELAVMRVFWDGGPGTAEEARQRLKEANVELAYVTVANVVRGLVEKRFLRQMNKARPFVYEPARTFTEVSKKLVGDLVERLFDGSRKELLVQVIGSRRLTKSEREFLEQALKDQGG
jgi:predicted transcriptional regulator